MTTIGLLDIPAKYWIGFIVIALFAILILYKILDENRRNRRIIDTFLKDYQVPVGSSNSTPLPKPISTTSMTSRRTFNPLNVDEKLNTEGEE